MKTGRWPTQPWLPSPLSSEGQVVTHPDFTQVAVLGLGAMGSRMVASLLKVGYRVTVYNRSPEPAQAVAKLGANAALSARAAVRDADFVIAMLRDDDASKSVWTDPEHGALAGMRAGAVAIDSATLTPGWVRELSAACKKRGVGFVEAPVAGSRPQADAGQLIYFLGGDLNAVETARPLLMAMGQAAHHVGPAGTAAVVKLLVNAMLGVQVAALAEFFGWVRKSGLDPQQVLEILGHTPVISPAAKAAATAMLTGQFAPMFPLELVEKDFGYAAQTAQEANAPVPVMNCVHQVLAAATAHGLAAQNITALARLY
jgi:3-hydroxyisobutyrate dehydrogenase